MQVKLSDEEFRNVVFDVNNMAGMVALPVPEPREYTALRFVPEAAYSCLAGLHGHNNTVHGGFTGRAVPEDLLGSFKDGFMKLPEADYWQHAGRAVIISASVIRRVTIHQSLG